MHPIVEKVAKALLLERRLLVHAQSGLLLLVRLVWGWQFFLTGKGKLGKLPQVTEFFASLMVVGRFHMPKPGLNAAIAGTTEMLGGLLLLLGLGGRVATIPLVFTMLVAYATAHYGEITQGWADDKFLDAFVGAAPFPFLMASLLVLAFGAGKLSLDHLIARWWEKQAPRAA